MVRIVLLSEEVLQLSALTLVRRSEVLLGDEDSRP
jgi:hypothetical protein